jgi:hypothetical protein
MHDNAALKCFLRSKRHTLLIQDNDIATVKVDSVRSAQAGHWRDVSSGSVG